MFEMKLNRSWIVAIQLFCAYFMLEYVQEIILTLKTGEITIHRCYEPHDGSGNNKRESSDLVGEDSFGYCIVLIEKEWPNHEVFRTVESNSYD